MQNPQTTIVDDDIVMLNDKLLYFYDKKRNVLKVSMADKDIDALVEEIGFYKSPKDINMPTSYYKEYVTFKNVEDIESLLPEETGYLLGYSSYRKPGVKPLTDYLKISPRNN